MEFPSNSDKVRAPKEEKPIGDEKVVKQVVDGAVMRKKTFGKRFMETFVGGDARSVSQYMLFEVLVPAAQSMIADAVSGGVERMIFGNDRTSSRSRSYRSGGGSSSFVSYNKFGSSRQDPREREREQPRMSRQARANHDFGEIVLPTRAEAELVRERLYDLVNEYQLATVADMLQLVGETPEYTDGKWGWDDLHGTEIRKIREGYLLELPRTKPVD